MIQFFRRIRRGLINQERIGKYLLYAIGEILLVVIGILIALYVNNSNTKRETENEIIKLFKKASTELEINLRTINAITRNYKLKDSIYYLTVQNKIEYKDYANGTIPLDWNTTSGMLSPINHNAITQLLDYEKEIPEKYRELFGYIKTLHYSYLSRVNDRLDQHTIFTLKLAENQLKYPWSAGYDQLQEDQKIDYYLNDPENKSWSSRYHQLAINFYLRRLVEYQSLAFQIYYEFGDFFDPIESVPKFDLSERWRWIEGQWTTSSGKTVRFTFENPFGLGSWDVLNGVLVKMDANGNYYQGSYHLHKNFLFYSFNNVDQQYYNLVKVNDNLFSLQNNNSETITYTRVLN